MRASPRFLFVIIPLIDRIVDHPSDPIASQAAIARNAGQGRPYGRRSLALDRSEHGGRLMASRDDGPSSLLSSIIATLIGCGVIVVAAPSASADPPSTHRGSTVAPSDPWAAHVAEAAQRFAIPAHWIRAVMVVESAGDRTARSPKGAMGLMQIMPKTWKELRARYALDNDPWQPRANIMAGAAYLRGSLAAADRRAPAERRARSGTPEEVRRRSPLRVSPATWAGTVTSGSCEVNATGPG